MPNNQRRNNNGKNNNSDSSASFGSRQDTGKFKFKNNRNQNTSHPHKRGNGSGGNNNNKRRNGNRTPIKVVRVEDVANLGKTAGANPSKKYYIDVWCGYFADLSLGQRSALKVFKNQIRTKLPDNKNMMLAMTDDKTNMENLVYSSADMGICRNLFIRMKPDWFDAIPLADEEDANMEVEPKKSLVKSKIKDLYDDCDELFPKLIKKFNPQGMVFFVVGQQATDAAVMAWASGNDHPILHYERPGIDPMSAVSDTQNKQPFNKANTFAKRIFEGLKTYKKFTTADDTVPEEISPKKLVDCSDL